MSPNPTRRLAVVVDDVIESTGTPEEYREANPDDDALHEAIDRLEHGQSTEEQVDAGQAIGWLRWEAA